MGGAEKKKSKNVSNKRRTTLSKGSNSSSYDCPAIKFENLKLQSSRNCVT